MSEKISWTFWNKNLQYKHRICYSVFGTSEDRLELSTGNSKQSIALKRWITFYITLKEGDKINFEMKVKKICKVSVWSW